MTKVAFLTFLALLLLNGCSSDYSGVGHGGSAGDQYTYGTGPNNTKPYPQQEQVNLNGVSGAKIRYESVPKRGNKDYNVLGKFYRVWNGCDSYIEEGTASWYGPGFNGKATSLGEIYDQTGFSAAHKNLPLPSYLKVTNLENGKKVIVRVNDRGPFHGDRIIDLSEGAARALNMIGKGTARVRIEFISVGFGGSLKNAFGTPAVAPSLSRPAASTTNTAQGSFKTVNNAKQNVNYTPAATLGNKIYIQIVASRDSNKAKELADIARRRVHHSVIVSTSQGISRVLIGPFNDENTARAILEQAKVKGFPDGFVKKF
ncbi:MAG: septal ring lytic transglycosylase RlpA family protein [Succinivibrio sp.]|nr:septal ring lytic transglycosylase RlpA family protein [Succinivibrio sp.]